MEINGKRLELRINTGAKWIYLQSSAMKINQAKAVQLVAYGGDTLSTLGAINFDCHVKCTKRNLEFHDVDRPVTPLLGLVDSLSMGLVQLRSEVHEVDIVKAFQAAVFDEYNGSFKGDLGTQLSCSLQDKARPQLCSCW